MNKNKLFSIQNVIILITLSIIVSIFFLLATLHLASPSEYGSNFFGYDKSDLGTLGDLIGGILNPVLSFVTIGLLLWSIRIQGRELSAATEQSKKSAKALEQTQSIHEESLAKAERNEIYSNTKDKYKGLINSFNDLVCDSICQVVYPNDRGQSLHTNFNLNCIPSLEDSQLDAAIAYMNSNNDIKKVYRALYRIEAIVKSISVHAKTYCDLGVPSIYYSEDFFMFHEKLNRIYGHLGQRINENFIADTLELISHNEILTWEILKHKPQTQTKPE